jgi:gluconokinase
MSSHRAYAAATMIVVVAGVAGSGKTTVGALLAGRLGWIFADGDSFHPAANVAKMAAGIPLTDADRWPWLRAIADWMDERIAAGDSAVIPCSALAERYRDLLLGSRPEARLVFLEVTRELARRRLAARHGHFFHAELVDSQFAALEPPQRSGRALLADAARPADEIVAEVIAWLGLAG